MKAIINLFYVTFFFLILKFKELFLCGSGVFLNDYLNPYTLTFKNPKTIQMFNIMILYHYVMAFLFAIIIFTFIFIFLSFFRTYFYFHFKPYYEPSPSHFSSLLNSKDFPNYFFALLNWIRYNMLQQKKKNMGFYKNDIKSSLNDQIGHAPTLEFLWVIFPALILVAIAYPSIVMLYYNESYVDPVFNITVIGNQWYWTYEYNDFNLLSIFKRHITHDNADLIRNLDTMVLRINEFKCMLFENSNPHLDLAKHDKSILSNIPRRITVDANLIIAKDPKFLRLLTTDQCLVIPAKTPIRLLITSNDVIHSWAIPSYGVKVDAVPGRVNQQIINVPLQGTSWGQCSELCGVNHAYMPIEIKVLHFVDFMFFMELRIKEVLLPHLVDYYQERIKIIRNTIKPILNYLKSGGDESRVNKEILSYIFSFDRWAWLISSTPTSLQEQHRERLLSFPMLRGLKKTTD